MHALQDSSDSYSIAYQFIPSFVRSVQMDTFSADQLRRMKVVLKEYAYL